MGLIFIWKCLSIIIITDTIRNRRIRYPAIVGIIIFIISYCIVEFKLLYTTFYTKSFIFHRIERDITKIRSTDLISNIKKTISLFIKTHYHTGSFITFAVIIAFIIAFFIAWRKNRLKPIFFWLPMTIVTICLIRGFYYFLVWSLGLGNFISLLKTFGWNRIFFLLPLLWFLLFAVSLNEISKFRGYNVIIYSLLILHLVLIGIENKEYQQNFQQLIMKVNVSVSEKILPNFKQFFAKNLFSQIKSYINIPQEDYKVVSIGIHPSIAQYNDFHTLDSYQYLYPLEYKHKFRPIMAKELAKDKELKNYFDFWGNRCYVFVSELKDKFQLCYKNKDCNIDNLDINTVALKELGGKYIFSAASINNYKQLNLTFEKLFKNKDSIWNIYLYKVN